MDNSNKLIDESKEVRDGIKDDKLHEKYKEEIVTDQLKKEEYKKRYGGKYKEKKKEKAKEKIKCTECYNYYNYSGKRAHMMSKKHENGIRIIKELKELNNKI